MCTHAADRLLSKGTCLHCTALVPSWVAISRLTFRRRSSNRLAWLLSNSMPLLSDSESFPLREAGCALDAARSTTMLSSAAAH